MGEMTQWSRQDFAAFGRVIWEKAYMILKSGFLQNFSLFLVQRTPNLVAPGYNFTEQIELKNPQSMKFLPCLKQDCQPHLTRCSQNLFFNQLFGEATS